MASAEHRTFIAPDEVRTFEKGRLELVEIGGGDVGRLVLEPGLALVRAREADRRHRAGARRPTSSTTSPGRSAC